MRLILRDEFWFEHVLFGIIIINIIVDDEDEATSILLFM